MTRTPVTITPNLTEFVEQFNESSVVPLSVDFILEDTPLSLLLHFPEDSFVCLLESLGSINKIEETRWTFIGLDPKVTFSVKGDQAVEHWRGETAIKTEAKGVIRQLDDFLRSFHSVYDDSMPLQNGGLIGYVSRDLLFTDLKSTPREAEAQPSLHYVVPQTFIIIDKLKNIFKLTVNAFAHGTTTAEEAYHEAKQILDAHIERLSAPPRTRPTSFPSSSLPQATVDEHVPTLADRASSLTDEAIDKQVAEVYLNQTLSQQTKADPISIYRIFRLVFPSAYCYLFRINGWYYIGSHEPADHQHSLSFANVLRHVLEDSRFTGAPIRAACELRRAFDFYYHNDSAVFGYVGFNGHYMLTHGNKEVMIKPVGSAYEAVFSQSLRATWHQTYPDRPRGNFAPEIKLVVSSAGSVSAAIRQILIAAQELVKL